MTTQTKREWRPFFAWAKSLPLAIGIPAGLWLIVILAASVIDGGSGAGGIERIVQGAVFAFIIVIYSAAVHFMAYVVVGIPLFFLMRRRRFLFFWKAPYGWILGAFAGIVPPLAVAGLLWGDTIYGEGTYTWILILGVYGLVTAFAAWTQRPRVEFQEQSAINMAT